VNDPISIQKQLIEQLHLKYGRLVLSFGEAALEVGFKSEKAGFLARNRGKFPLAVFDRAGRLAVTLAEVARYSATGVPAAPVSSTGLKRRPGRPTKAEQLARAAAAATQQ